MHDHRPDDALTPQPTEADALVGRLLDREASMQERHRFEGLAAAEPELWRTLAESLLDMDMLAGGVEEQVSAADRIEISAQPATQRLAGLAVTLSGWAAVLLLGIVWVVAAARGPAESLDARRVDVPLVQPKLTAPEHLREYLDSPHVLGQMAPLLLEVERLPDGTERRRILRRIEEYEYPGGTP